ncbi:unnamed protein product, partial [Phaeothamnion confervicola]
MPAATCTRAGTAAPDASTNWCVLPFLLQFGTRHAFVNLEIRQPASAIEGARLRFPRLSFSLPAALVTLFSACRRIFESCAVLSLPLSRTSVCFPESTPSSRPKIRDDELTPKPKSRKPDNKKQSYLPGNYLFDLESDPHE